MVYNSFDLNSLKIFISVYENESMLAASKKLFLSQPAITIAIKKLEEGLGGKLFVRLPKGIKPTPEGRQFYQQCKEGLSKIEQGIKNFSDESFAQNGTIQIGADTSVIKFLLPKIKQFLIHYPHVKISFTEVIAKRLQEYLIKGNIDVAFELTPIKNIEAFDCVKVATLENIFVVGSKTSSILTPIQLSETPLATLKANTNHRLLFEEVCQNHGIHPNIQFEAANFDTIINIIKQTNSIGFVAKEMVSEELTKQEVYQQKTTLTLPQTQLYALLPKGNNNSFICEKFLSFL